tara:strand:+ start:11297 stop:11623 length:327 start_codon:yes stop_codon:yes gene_type:complete
MDYSLVNKALCFYLPQEIVDIIYKYILILTINDIHIEYFDKLQRNNLLIYQNNKACNWLVEFERQMIIGYRYVYSDNIKLNKIRNNILTDNYLYNRSAYKRKKITLHK